MNLSRDELLQLEAATGFRAATLEKVVRMGAVAREIAAHPFLGPRLVLKGGTAIQLALGAPQRLSVDLDYNYIGQLAREAMLAERPEVEADLLRVARAGRYQVSQSADEHAARKFQQQLVPMLSGAARPSREDLVRRSWDVLAPILDLDGPEREYCDRLQRGELKPELLFGDDAALAERFRRHPALQWKAANALAHQSRGQSGE